MILNYKKPFDADLLTVEPPCKNDKLHVSNILYAEEALSLQLRGLLVEKNKLKISQNDARKVLEFFQTIEKSISTFIYNQSENFFNGKKFSLEKIQTSIHKFYEISKNGEVYVKFRGDNYSCIDHYGKDISFDEVKETTCDIVVELKGITYIKSVSNIDVIIKGVKQGKKKTVAFDFLDTEPIVEKKEIKTDDLDFF